MTAATADTEEEMLTMVPHQMMCVVARGVGMPWRTTVVTIAEGEVADGGDLADVVRNGPAMTTVGVG